MKEKSCVYVLLCMEIMGSGNPTKWIKSAPLSKNGVEGDFSLYVHCDLDKNQNPTITVSIREICFQNLVLISLVKN